MVDLRLSVLDELEIEYGGESLDGLTSIKAQALLIYLGVTDRAHSRQTLGGLLWSDVMERSARTSLRTALSQLRRSIGTTLMTDRNTVTLDPAASCWVDALVFEQACRRIRMGVLEQASDDDALRQTLREAVYLYRREFLAGFPETDAALFEEWVLTQREHYRRLALDALLSLASDALARNRADVGIQDARRALIVDSLHEPAYRLLMQLYAASGQRAAAQQQYSVCAQLLLEELDALPSQETTALHTAIQQGESSIVAQAPVPAATPISFPATSFPARHNLPAQTTPLVGRQEELAALTTLLSETDVRMVTVLGPGGMGKTHLSLAAATALLPDYPQGVFWVELAPLINSADIPVAVANALNIPPQSGGEALIDQLLVYHAERQMLLVLDNFEHLLDGAEFVHALLQAAPRVKVLVTSRARLQLNAERVFALGGVPVPSIEQLDSLSAFSSNSRNVFDYGAVQLFLQCAQRTRPTFELDDANVVDVVRVCHLVYGIPLAILIAASWIDVLSARDIADEISRSLDFLATELRDMPARHHSIRAVFNSSWRRLSSEEQGVLMRLAVFRGGLTRMAAASVAHASLPILSSLVNGSLLRRDSAQRHRYRVHELLRQFAEEQLRAANEWEATCDAHSAYYADFMQALESDVKGRRQLEALQEIEADWDNVRVAWQWAVQRRDYEAIDKALESAYWYCIMRSRLLAGQELLQLAQQQLAPAPSEEPHRVWGKIMARAMKSNIRYLEPVDRIKSRVETALTIAQSPEDKPEIAFCLWALGMAATSVDDYVSALPYFEQSLAIYESIDDRFYIAWLLYYVGAIRAKAHQSEDGALGQSLEIRRALGDQIGVAYSLHEIGVDLLLTNALSEGEPYLAEAYAIQKEMGNRQGMCENLVGLAAVAFAAGDFERVRQYAIEIREIADEMNSARHKGIAESRLGQLAFIAHNLDESRRHFERALSVVTEPEYGVMCVTEYGLSQVAFENEEYRKARGHLRRALEYKAQAARAMRPLGDFICQAAWLMAQTGHYERATSLLALASMHEASEEVRLAQLQSVLETNQSPEDFATAWARGKLLPWEDTRDELIIEFSD